jgi:hypothetical protein
MADETLQAFQLGASLFDRAQTQKRMMEQFQLQSAESLLQQQGLQLQNKIRDISLADAIGEQKSQVEEFDAFSTLGKQVSDYLNNPKPDAKFPVVPAFKSKQYRIEADRMLNNLEKYSARAELLKTQDKARTDSITKQTAILKEAMSIPGAVNIDPNTDVPTINWPVYNAGRKQLFESQVQKTQAQTTSILGNLEVAKNNLNRLVKEGADKNSIAEATLNYKKALDEEKMSLEKSKFDFTKGLQLDKLALEKVKVDQLGKRADAYVQKILQPAKVGEIKLNAVDDRLVKKAADDIANKQGISDAIGYEIGVLDDPSIDEYVKRASAQNILKILNSAEGKDAVGVEESKRLGQFLEFQLNPVKGFSTGRVFGTDLPRFVEQIQIKKDELDTRVSEGMNRVNSIYRKYGKDIPAGTSQTPSRGTMITAPAPQAMSSTNTAVSVPSFRTIQEAKAAGVQPGARVIINGVQGTIK